MWTPRLLADLPQEEVRRVLAAARRRRFDPGEVVFHEGDPADTLHFIVSGRVAATVTHLDGQKLTFALIGQGEFFGELALLTGSGVRSATIRALEATETRSIHRREFEALRRRHPGVNEILMRILAESVLRLSRQLHEALYLPVETRIRRRLIELLLIYGGSPDSSVVPLTQEELAGLAGTTRATVNRVLRQEVRLGAVHLARNRVTVIDPQALAKSTGY